jgi:hypothetical protein
MASVNNLRCGMIFVLAMLQTSGQAGTFPSAALKPGAPSLAAPHDMKSLVTALTGSWLIHLSFPRSPQMPNGGEGDGEEVWRAGPGANSLIEDYHSVGADGDLSGLAILRPATNGKGLQVLWCDNALSSGCRTLNDNADWKDGGLVLSDERYEDGKKHLTQEIFTFDTPDSFTQTLSEGESAANLKPFLTISATRRRPKVK